MKTKPTSGSKKTLKSFAIRELETLKTTAAYYIPVACPTQPGPVS